MKAMSEAIEGAQDFLGFMDKIMADEKRQAQVHNYTPDLKRYGVVEERQPCENRAAHRARLKRERREAKADKVAR